MNTEKIADIGPWLFIIAAAVVATVISICLTIYHVLNRKVEIARITGESNAEIEKEKTKQVALQNGYEEHYNMESRQAKDWTWKKPSQERKP